MQRAVARQPTFTKAEDLKICVSRGCSERIAVHPADERIAEEANPKAPRERPLVGQINISPAASYRIVLVNYS